MQEAEKFQARLYFAYGSNLCLRQMLERCPQSRPLNAWSIAGWRLGFVGESSRWGQGGVATMTPGDGTVHGALYWLTPEDELRLDGFEGVDHAAELEGEYVRDLSSLTYDGQPVLVYIATAQRGRENKPNERYLEVIREGYSDWGLPLEELAGIECYPQD